GRLRSSAPLEAMRLRACVTVPVSRQSSLTPKLPASSKPSVSTRLRLTSIGGGPESKSMALRYALSNQVAVQPDLPPRNTCDSSISYDSPRSATRPGLPTSGCPSAYIDGSLKALPQA